MTFQATAGREPVAIGHQASEHGHHGHHDTGKRLGLFLCWTVVFADIAAKVRPSEILAEAEATKRIRPPNAPAEGGLAVSLNYVRCQTVEGVWVATYVPRKLYQEEPEA